MAGGGGGDTQKIEFNNPFENEVRQLTDATLGAQQQVAGIGPFQGRFVAQEDPRQQQALQMQQAGLAGLQGPGGQQFGQNVVDLANRTIGGEFLDANNPLLQGAIQAASNPILEAQRRALQQAGAGAQGAGAFAGNRLGLLQSDLAQQTQENIGDVSGRLAFQNLQAERDRQVQAANLLAQGAGLTQLPGELLGRIGETARGFEQDEIQNALLQFEELNAAPFRSITPAAEIFNTLGVQATPAGQTITGPEGPSQASSAIQGGLGGAAAGFAVGGPIGAVAGGLLGAGASFL